MNKSIKNIRYYVALFLLSLLFVTQSLSAQNIRLKVERLGLQIYQPSYGKVCNTPNNINQDIGVLTKIPDPVVNTRLKINGAYYTLPEFSAEDFLWEEEEGVFNIYNCVAGWTNHG